MNSTNRYQELANKWLAGTINEAEKMELSAWYNSFDDDTIDIPDSFSESEYELKDRILAKVKERVDIPSPHHRIRYRFNNFRAVAATVAFFFLIGVCYYTMVAPNVETKHALSLNDISPADNKANLTFADGRAIELDQEQSQLIIDGDVQYLDGTKLYDKNDKNSTQYAILSTPKGGRYQLKLSDGSKVWLNASSSIRFPSEFNGSPRTVELLRGEAYFEINKQTSKDGSRIPFFVKLDQQLVEVLGTKFNINSYVAKKGVVTTVTEGVVTVQKLDALSKQKPDKVRLTAGRQAIVDHSGIKENQVDVEGFTAWKQGFFYFNDDDIHAVMDEFARWYDIDVTYEIAGSNDLFSGYIPRDVTLGQALHLLKVAGVNFELRSEKNLVVKHKK
ncbi:FecR domain-containing protein [Sphingobacterium sp. DN00404]|uniref:FecR domain-containing protein n=1 Tax=Sphingobacterium micropteri TaxID=2763501 RepID=A0ABR7YK20_9SPHI|nr:FecR family protein [Sphingobacterium micropteri]MBD1431548.1 FecR domain-containing protein [Sphingobacterium micropteri]